MSQTISHSSPASVADARPADPLEAGDPRDSGEGLEALLHRAAIALLPDRGWIRVSGEDRMRWLNGMVTNAVAALGENEGSYNFFLNAQGQIQGDADVFSHGKELLLETDRESIPRLLEMLERFIIMDDVELAGISAGERSGLLLAGPDSPALLETVVPRASLAPQLSLNSGTLRDIPLTIVHAGSPLVARFELWGAPTTINSLHDELANRPVPIADSRSLEALRILEGTPRFGTDIRGRELPQETAQTRALHFSKGCYLGQEIVERIRSRGKVHRTFSGFTVAGGQAIPGVEIFSGDQAIGVLTSVAELAPLYPLFPAGSRPALGYIRRDVLEGGRALTCGGEAATPSPLPFRLGQI